MVEIARCIPADFSVSVSDFSHVKPRLFSFRSTKRPIQDVWETRGGPDSA